MNVFNENKEKPRVSKAHYCTNSKKEVSGDLFVSSCHTCLTAMGKFHKRGYMAEFFMPYLHKYSVLEAKKHIFV